MSDLHDVQLGPQLIELPKSKLPAGLADESGAYPFFCSSPEPKAIGQWLVDGEAVVLGTGGVASVNFGRGKFAYSTDCWAIQARRSELSTEYLYRVLQQQLHRIDYAGFEGSGLRHLRKDFIRNLTVSAPGEDVQARVSEILAAVDDAIAQTEELIAKTQQIKAGLMHDLFTRGVMRDGQLRPPREQAPELYKGSSLGWIPVDWNVESLDEIAQRGSGHTPSKRFPEYWNGGIKWISLADSWRLDSVHISDTDNEISQRGIENSSAVLHPPGIVVLSRDAGIGKSAITTREMAVSQHFMCWRCGPRLNNYFLYYWLQYRKWEFENIATGSTIPTIGLRFFKNYRICTPIRVAEQEKIAADLLASDERIFSLEASLAKLKRAHAGLMNDLLTGRIAIRNSEAVGV